MRSPLALRCSKEQNALHTLIRQRHLTPSCGGHRPYRGENPGPGKDVHESLTPGPELENSQGHSRPIGTINGMSALPANATATGNTFHDAAHAQQVRGSFVGNAAPTQQSLLFEILKQCLDFRKMNAFANSGFNQTSRRYVHCLDELGPSGMAIL